MRRPKGDLNAYFAEPHQVRGDDPVYSGRFFERIGGGGDRTEVRDRVTAEDLVAVQTLSVTVPPETTISILHGELGRRLNRHLHEIPTDIALGDSEAREHLIQGAAADKAWHLLKQEPGAGYVTAGKLLARKRPHLIPVYDSVVRCALGEPQQVWLSLHAILADDETGLRRRLAQLRSTCRIPVEASALRILDVVVWKGHRRHHARVGCTAPGTTGLAS